MTVTAAADGQPTPDEAEVFISYASSDREKVQRVADELGRLGIRLWFAKPGFHQTIQGGEHFAPAIARGIKAARVLVLMCSDAALRSPNVNQEIMLAWKYRRPYLPLLLEPVSYPEQSEYFLEGWQWIELLDSPVSEWLPKVELALSQFGVATPAVAERAAVTAAAPAGMVAPPPGRPRWPVPGAPRPGRADLAGLRALASFTDRLWPVPAESVSAQARPAFRGLGAQPGRRRGHRLGSRVSLAIDSDRAGHLLLLDEGPEQIIYCLCPSLFAPETRISTGLHHLPQEAGGYEAFELSGAPGREHLLAIVSDDPLPLDWMSADAESPARVLDGGDVAELLRLLDGRDPASWSAFATYFDVLP